MLSNAPTPEELDVKRYVLHLNDGSTQTVESTNVFSACHKLGWGSGDIQMRLKYAEELPSYDALRLSLEAARGELAGRKEQLTAFQNGIRNYETELKVARDEVTDVSKDLENVQSAYDTIYFECRTLRADLDAAHAKLAAYEKDAARYRFCLKHGFSVQNQTALDENYRWIVIVDKIVYYGATPSAAIDSALAALVEGGAGE